MPDEVQEVVHIEYSGNQMLRDRVGGSTVNLNGYFEVKNFNTLEGTMHDVDTCQSISVKYIEMMWWLMKLKYTRGVG
jgi:hypothetical protein